MKIIRNIVIEGKHQKPILTDIFFIENNQPKPIVIFSHGFKGFKDWGHWDLVAEKFANAGFVFVKFNFSHNGTTVEQPTEFVDLEAFGHNNFSIELDDLGCTIDWIINSNDLEKEVDKNKINLIGHSRGGGIVILKAYEDKRVTKIATWASVNNFGKRWPKEKLESWKKRGVAYVENARTQQQMPMYYQLAEDYYKNPHRLHLPTAIKNLDIPFLVIHGTMDDDVPIEEAKEIIDWNPKAKLMILENADHVFGAFHPFTENQLPKDVQKAVDATIQFFYRK